MEFFDKSKNRKVALDENLNERLVILNTDDAENVSVPGSLLTSGGTVTPVSSRALRISLPTDAESLAVADKGLATLSENEGVELVATLAQDETGAEVFVVPNHISVLIRGLSKAKANDAIKALGYKLEKSGRSRGLYLVTTPDGTDLGEAIDKINTIHEVLLAEPVFVGIEDQELTFRVTINRPGGSDAENLDSAHSSPTCALDWNHDRIRISTAWTKTQGSAKVIIAVVDGAPETDHDALKNRLFTNLEAEMRFADGSGTSAHATNVASIALGGSDCFSGIAPGCRLLPLVVDLTVQEYWRRADAIFYAAERARAGTIKGKAFDRMVMVCSWKMAGDISIVRLALAELVEAGVLVVTSAGNRDTSAAHWPSDYAAMAGPLGDGILSVAATDAQDARAYYSNWSDKVDLAAPGGDGPPYDGGDLRCAGLFNSYDRQAGTSLAVPHVAAVAALALSRDPKLDVGALKALLKDTTDPITSDRPIGTGRLNAANVLAVLETDTAPAPLPEPVEDDTPPITGTDTVPDTDTDDDAGTDIVVEDNPPDTDDTTDDVIPDDTSPDGPTLTITVVNSAANGETTEEEDDLAALVTAFRNRTESETNAELASIEFHTASGTERFDFDT